LTVIFECQEENYFHEKFANSKYNATNVSIFNGEFFGFLRWGMSAVTYMQMFALLNLNKIDY